MLLQNANIDVLIAAQWQPIVVVILNTTGNQALVKVALADLIITAMFSFSRSMEHQTSEEFEGGKQTHANLLLYMADKFQQVQQPKSTELVRLENPLPVDSMEVIDNPVASRRKAVGAVDW